LGIYPIHFYNWNFEVNLKMISLSL
jgi:hypothetical protein